MTLTAAPASEYETEREAFVAGTMWRPTPQWLALGDPCPCGNDGVCCDLLEEGE